MRVVVDLGCYDPPGGFNSLAALTEEFKPDFLYGFDPLADDFKGDLHGACARIWRAAAWDADCDIRFHRDGTSSAVAADGETVAAFDFSAWLADVITPADKVVVKMDIEGAEYPVLAKMRADETDALVDLLLIEWHGDPVPVGCPSETWWN